MRKYGPENSDLLTVREVAPEYHARRRLFFAAMRRPEMRLVRAALLVLRDEKGVDWRQVTSLEIVPSSRWSDSWILLTDRHECVCFWPEGSRPDFSVYRLHDESDPFCDCDVCQAIRANVQEAIV